MRWITQMPSMGKHTVYTAVYSWKRGRRCPYASQTSLLQDDGSNLMCLYAWLMSLPFPRFVYTHVKRTAHTHTLTIETAFRLAACANIQCLTCMRPQARFGMAAVTQHTDTHTHRRANTCGTYASTTISYFCSDGGVAISRTSPSSWIAYETCAATATDGLGDESSSAIGWSTERRYPTRVVFGLNFQLLHRRKKKTQWFSGFVLVLWNNWVFEWFNFFLPCCAIAALLICFCYLGMFILLLWTRCVAHFSFFFFASISLVWQESQTAHIGFIFALALRIAETHTLFACSLLRRVLHGSFSLGAEFIPFPADAEYVVCAGMFRHDFSPFAIANAADTHISVRI